MKARETVKNKYPNAYVKLTEFKPVNERPKRYFKVYNGKTSLGEGKSEKAAWSDACQNLKVQEFYSR